MGFSGNPQTSEEETHILVHTEINQMMVSEASYQCRIK